MYYFYFARNLLPMPNYTVLTFVTFFFHVVYPGMMYFLVFSATII